MKADNVIRYDLTALTNICGVYMHSLSFISAAPPLPLCPNHLCFVISFKFNEDLCIEQCVIRKIKREDVLMHICIEMLESPPSLFFRIYFNENKSF